MPKLATPSWRLHHRLVVFHDRRPARHRRRRPARDNGPDACWRWESRWCGRARRHARPAPPPPTNGPSSLAASSGLAAFSASRMWVEEIFSSPSVPSPGRRLTRKAFHLAHIAAARSRLPPRPLPNWKSAPTTTPADAQPLHQHVAARNSCALRRRHRGIEGQRKHHIHAQLRHQPRLGAERRQAEGIPARGRKNSCGCGSNASTPSGASARFRLRRAPRAISA